MINYIYDGSFEGLLTVFAQAFRKCEEVNAISATEEDQPDLFTEIKRVEADSVIADCFFKKLAGTLAKDALMDVAYCYLSEERGMEKVIFDYILLLFAAGCKGADNYLSNTVFKVKRIRDKVAHEIDRMHGFIRFRKLADGIYYAPVEPDYNIVQFLAPHFTARFADQKWLIHDRKRGNGIYYDGLRCLFLPDVSISPEITRACAGTSSHISDALDKEELHYQKLWDQYFKQIAITERRNKRLQKQRMPVRYWRYLVEDVAESNQI